MANYLGTLEGNCTEEQVYSGRENCAVIPGKITSLDIHPRNTDYPAEKEQYLAGYQGYHTIDGPSRMIFVGKLSGNDPTGGDLQTSESGNYGNSVTTGVNSLTVAYQVEDGDPCLYKELSKLNGRTMRIFENDENGFQFGTVFENSQDELRRRGFLGRIYVYEVPATGTTPYQLYINIDYSQDRENERKNMDAVNIGTTGFAEGLTAVRLVEGVKVVTNCGAFDITEEFADDWDVTMFETEAGTRPTTVTYLNGNLTIAPAGSYRVAGAAILAAGGIEGYDGLPEYLTVTAKP